MALINYNRQNYPDAYQNTEKVINLYPMDYDMVILMVWTNLQMGKNREAKVLYNKALFLNLEDESALNGLSKIQ